MVFFYPLLYKESLSVRSFSEGGGEGWFCLPWIIQHSSLVIVLFIFFNPLFVTPPSSAFGELRTGRHKLEEKVSSRLNQIKLVVFFTVAFVQNSSRRKVGTQTVEQIPLRRKRSSSSQLLIIWFKCSDWRIGGEGEHLKIWTNFVNERSVKKFYCLSPQGEFGILVKRRLQNCEDF